jgi:hypothetical protein
MSADFSLSFSDATTGLHALIRSAHPGVLIAAGTEHALPPAQQLSADAAAGRWQFALPGFGELELGALGPAADFASGPESWLCRARGTVALASSELEIDSLGALTLDPPHPAPVTLRRHLWLAFGEEFAVLLTAAREGSAAGHGEEQVEAYVLRGTPLKPVAIDHPRLSTSFGAAGLISHAGLELREHEPPGRPLRIGAEPLARAALPGTGSTSLAATFVDAHSGDQRGCGCYLLERTTAR